MPGVVDTPHEVYFAESAERMEEPSDAEELAHIDWLPLSRALELVAYGELLGSGSIVGLLYVLAGRRRGSLGRD
jgi:hypothetical protein